MELSIQKFIRENSLEAAVTKWNLKVNETEHYVQLNYDQIDTPSGVIECDECRGLVLDKADYSVAAMSFRRFFNAHEGNAAKPDINTSYLLEKLDGSLMTLWWDKYQDQWVVSTRGRIFADGEVGSAAQKVFTDDRKTFSELFWSAVNPSVLAAANERCCYVFELTGPANRILTPYKNTEIRLIGARDLKTMKELSHSDMILISNLMEVGRPKVYKAYSMENVKELFNDLEPTDEGFVLVDYSKYMDDGINFARVKVKNPRYLALSKLLHAGTGELMDMASIVSLIRTGEVEEVIGYFPEYKDKIHAMQKTFADVCSEIDTTYAAIKDIPVQKDFALEAQKTRCPSALYAIRKGQYADAKAFMMQLREESLLAMLKGE